jgi:hypothetical protein
MKSSLIIPVSSLEKLVRYSRVTTYIMSSLKDPKAYIVLNGAQMTLFFKEQKSLMSFEIQIINNNILPNTILSIDISKFLSIIKKIGDINPIKVEVSISPPTIKLMSTVTNDRVTLSVNFHEPTSPEMQAMTTFYASKEPSFTPGIGLSVTTELLTFIGLAISSMSPVIKTNCIIITDENVSYVDRTFVALLNQKICSTPVAELKVHRVILEFMEYIAPENPLFTFSSDKKAVLWKSVEDPTFWAILAVETCVSPVLSSDDIANLIPLEDNMQVVTCTPAQLLEGVGFFTGLFDSTPWKPITFTWSKSGQDQLIKLSYIHPSTEIEKSLTCEKIDGTLKEDTASFQLMSESLKSFIHRVPSNSVILIKFNNEETDVPNGAGVYIECREDTNMLYSAVFAKMRD